MLRDLPIPDVSGYTFIDMGSGKGRMLLLAAEPPFRRIIGVEFASDLDALARSNVKTYRNPKASVLSDRTGKHGCDVVRISSRTIARLLLLSIRSVCDGAGHSEPEPIPGRASARPDRLVPQSRFVRGWQRAI
jgi:hypothetical protein